MQFEGIRAFVNIAYTRDARVTLPPAPPPQLRAAAATCCAAGRGRARAQLAQALAKVRECGGFELATHAQAAFGADPTIGVKLSSAAPFRVPPPSRRSRCIEMLAAAAVARHSESALASAALSRQATEMCFKFLAEGPAEIVQPPRT